MCHLAVLFLQDDSPGRLNGFWRQFAEIYDDFGCRRHFEASVDLALGMARSGALAVFSRSCDRAHWSVGGVERDIDWTLTKACLPKVGTGFGIRHAGTKALSLRAKDYRANIPSSDG